LPSGQCGDPEEKIFAIPYKNYQDFLHSLLRDSSPPCEIQHASPVFPESWAKEFAYRIALHHRLTRHSLNKETFEYALVETCISDGMKASCFPPNHPGADVRVGDEVWSLKTQSDKNIKREFVTFHKFMEAGKGAVNTNSDRVRLVHSVRQHAAQYDRLFVLRALPKESLSAIPDYELLEVPVRLFIECPNGPLSVSDTSDRQPQPFSINVPQNGSQSRAYQLYFDGGSERKIKIKYLDRKLCIPHVLWSFA
jgi:type II restriction enzyme